MAYYKWSQFGDALNFGVVNLDSKEQMRMSQPNINVHQILLSAKERVAEFAMTQLVPSIT